MDRRIERLPRAGNVAALVITPCKHAPRIDMIFLEFNHAFIGGDRTGVIATDVPQSPEIEMRLREIRIESNRLPEDAFRFGELFHASVRRTEIGEDWNRAGINGADGFKESGGVAPDGGLEESESGEETKKNERTQETKEARSCKLQIAKDAGDCD